jgi:uncharacterized protein (DUF58 family)
VPRLRKRAAALLAGAGVLFFVGTNVQAGWLFVLAAFLVGAVIAGFVMPGRMLRGLVVTRAAPSEIRQFQEALVDISILNNSKGTRISIQVDDPHLSPTRLFAPLLGPGQLIEIATLRVARRRGLFDTTSVTVSTTAPFGVARRLREVAVEGATLVLPVVVELGDLSFIQPAPALDSAIHTVPRRGQGPEYLGVREYRTGDSMRHVHWPSTARAGAIMVREFEQETTRRLAIVVDSSRDSGEEWTPLDRCCSAAGSIALAASARGQGARLIASGGAGTEILARAESGELLRKLAMLSPHGLADMGQVVSDLAAELRGVQTVVLVFPTWRANSAQVLAPAVRSLGDKVARVVALAVVVDPDEAPGMAAGRLEIATLEAALLDAGAEVYVWRPGAELSDALAPPVVIA